MPHRDGLDTASLSRLLERTDARMRSRERILGGGYTVTIGADGAAVVAFDARNGAVGPTMHMASTYAMGDLEAAGYAVTREQGNRGPVLVVRPLMQAIYQASAQHAAQVWERAGARIAVQPADPKREAGRDAADLQHRTWRVEQWIRATAETDRGSAYAHACSALSREGASRILARHALQTIAAEWGAYWARQASGALERDTAAHGEASAEPPTRWVEYEPSDKRAA
jgi:hypothetical protein